MDLAWPDQLVPYISLGLIDGSTGRWADSVGAYSEGRRLARALGIPWPPHSLTELYERAQAGRWREFLGSGEEDWQFHAGVPNPTASGTVEWIVTQYCSELLLWPAEAARWAQRELAPQWHNPTREVVVQMDLAVSNRLRGEPGADRDLPTDVVPGTTVHPLMVRSYLDWFAGEWDRGSQRLEAGIEARRSIGDRTSVTFLSFALTRFRVVQQDFAGAEALLREAIELYPDLPCRSELSLVYADLERWEEAAREVELCVELLKTDDDWRGRAGQVALAQGVVAGQREGVEAAAAHFEQALETFRSYQLPWQEADAQRRWADALERAAESDAAEEKRRAARASSSVNSARRRTCGNSMK